MEIRSLTTSDYEFISPIVDQWWGGRPVRQMLPRLFFEHFSTTSFILLEGMEIQAFLVGFQSQSHPTTAYIHFVGVSPASRGNGYGRTLYQHFFERVRSLGCTTVECITSPINGDSISFHRRLGFSIVNAGGEQNGISVSVNYAGEGQHRVLFVKTLGNPELP